MTAEDKRILRVNQTFTRDEFLSMINISFETHLKKYNKDWNQEEFSVYDTDIDVLRISMFHYKDFNNIRDIFINTWNGGWEHLQSYIKIEWREKSYSIEIGICDGESYKSRVISLHKLKDKKEMTELLIDFLNTIEPIKCIPLKRDYKLSLII